MSTSRKVYYKEVVGDRQMYRRVANEVKSTVEMLKSISENNSDVSVTQFEDNETYTSLLNDSSHSSNQSLFSNSNVFRTKNNTEIEMNSNCVTYSPGMDASSSSRSSSSETTASSSSRSSSETNNLQSSLREWALRNNITLSGISELLHILSPLDSTLPLDARTLLHTPVSTVDHKQLDNGEYIHFGLIKILKRIIVKIPFGNSAPIISISFNIDGIPVFSNNNSPITFWPILGLIKNVGIKQKCFVIGVFCGKDKPKPINIFLNDFVQEVSFLVNNGLHCNGKMYSVKIHSFICDVPAKAYLKCIKGHNGYSSCDRCTVVGQYVNRHMIFDSMTSQKRTSESFLQQRDGDHHNSVSPLVSLPIDFINIFVIDYMHCVCLGVVKKMINSWIQGKFYNVRLKARDITLLSDYLTNLCTALPDEFNRKPSKITEISYWKATQFRTFLLYLGPIVLKEFMDIAVYEHFLLLQSAMSILLSKRHLNMLGCDLAEKFLCIFVKHSKHLYGLDFLVHNVHSLIHIVDDVRLYGVLDNISAFPFENHLGALKRLIRSANKPLKQLYRRLIELNQINKNAEPKDVQLNSNWRHSRGPLLSRTGSKQYNKIFFQNVKFCTYYYSRNNSYCLSEEKKVLQIHNILVYSETNIIFICKQFLSYKSLFTYPFDSSNLQIFVVDNLSVLIEINITDILTKCIVFPLKDNTLASFPLLHNIYTA